MAKDPRHLEAARAYLAGPMGVRGAWDRACYSVGFTRVPPIDSKVCQAALTAVRREQQDAPPPAEPSDPDLEALVAAVEGPEPPSWDELAGLARRVMGRIASGRTTASPGQVTALREIVTRAEGRAGDQRETDDAIVHVVILPATDPRMGPVIDLGKISDLQDDDVTLPGLTIRQIMGGRVRG